MPSRASFKLLLFFILYNFVPHSPQNFDFGEISAPQFGQTDLLAASFAPHSPQNFADFVFAAPHSGQNFWFTGDWVVGL